MFQALTSVGRETLQIVLPSPCIVCEKELPLFGRFGSCCTGCWSSLPRITEAKCRYCATPRPGSDPFEPFTCISCTTERPSLDAIDSWGHYRAGLERVLHAFKFEKHDFMAEPLASLLETTLGQQGDHDFDAIVPVPMHGRRLRSRGYNQAELLSDRLASRSGISHDPSLLRRREEREPQSTLPRSQRAGNVRGVFEASARARALSILLIDDICTTGATLSACGSALMRNGARKVTALTVARA